MGRTHLSIVLVGHVDAGKSTTTGCLLTELGGFEKRKLDKLKEEAKRLGKDTFFYAFVMDTSSQERERGVTINCSVKEFFTGSEEAGYHYTVIDAPGHRDFVKNMITGSAQADVGLILVPASGFEEAIQKEDKKAGKQEGQTRQHAHLLKLLGVEQVLVGVNKMDANTVDYAEERFREIEGEMRSMLKACGYKKTENIPVIPYAGLHGENLVKKSEKMPWYKGWEAEVKVKNADGKSEKKKVTGHTILDALTDFVQPPERNETSEMRMPVSSVFTISGIGDVVTGRIEQGTLKPETKVKFLPSGIKGKVYTIEMHHKNQELARSGDNVGLNVKNLPKDKKFKPKGGEVMVCDDSDLIKGNGAVGKFTAQVEVLNHSGELKAGKDGKGGYTPIVYCRQAKCPCRIDEIKWGLHKKHTGGNKVEHPPHISKGYQAEVVFEPRQDLFVEKFENCKGLGRIAVMDSNAVVMLGKVIDVEYRK